MKTVNLKSDMPSVQEALQRLEREIAVARQGKLTLLKVAHGYGSSGVGGDIRIAVQKRLHELAEAVRFAPAFSAKTGQKPTKRPGDYCRQSPP
jgi:hypothetical protein